MNPQGCCRLCFEEQRDDLIKIFGDNEFTCVSAVLSKHFWFLVLQNDNKTSDAICYKCWCKVSEFHEFFKKIERAQANSFFPRYRNDKLQNHSNIVFIKEELYSTEPLTIHSQFDTPSNESDEENEKHSDRDEVPGTKKKSKAQPALLSLLKEQKKKEDELIREYVNMTCALCEFVSKTFYEANIHSKNVHKQRASLTCCRRKIYGRSEALDHIATHKNPNAFKCKVCEKVYVSKIKLTAHMKQHDQNFSRFHCQKCPKSFLRKTSLNYHLSIRHAAVEEKDLACSTCKKRFINVRSLNQHIRRVCSDGARRQLCDICAKEFSSEHNLRIHRILHLENQPKVQCKICEKWLKNEETLRVHLRYHSTAAKTCNVCGVTYRNSTSLIMHKRIHLKPTHFCVVCNKGFRTASKLKNHTVTHTGRTYKCKVCFKIFTRKSDVEAHHQQEHEHHLAE